MQDDAEDEYFLGDGGDDDSGGDGDGRSARRGALLGLAVVVVVVTVAITLTSLLVDTTPATDAPRTAARRWSETLVRGDTAARRRLECATPTDIGDVLSRLLAGTRYRVSAGRARSRGTARWAVSLQVDSPDGSPVTSTSVTVVREAGRYLVCWPARPPGTFLALNIPGMHTG